MAGPAGKQYPFTACFCAAASRQGLGPVRPGGWARPCHWRLCLRLQVLVKEFQGHAVSYRLSLTYHHLSVPQLPMPGGAWNLLQFKNLVAVGTFVATFS